MGVARSNRHKPRSTPAASPPPTRSAPAPAVSPASPASAAAASPSSAASANGSPNGRPPRMRTLTFTIPSTTLAVREVHKQIMDCVEACHYDEQATFAIRLALEEGMANAIKHGNGSDPNKKVHVEARVMPGRTELLIQDEGPGFNRNRVPDCTAKANLSRPSGRGILLIESYMSRARWDRGGRRLRMARDNAPLEVPQRKKR